MSNELKDFFGTISLVVTGLALVSTMLCAGLAAVGAPNFGVAAVISAIVFIVGLMIAYDLNEPADDCVF